MPRTAMRSTTDIYVAKDEFWCNLDGEATLIRRGDRVRSGHPLLRDQGEHFEPVELDVKYDVEQATAAPGELRAR